MKPSTHELAVRVKNEGRPVVVSWCDEGSTESGPLSYTQKGWRWGQIMLLKSVTSNRYYLSFWTDTPLGKMPVIRSV